MRQPSSSSHSYVVLAVQRSGGVLVEAEPGPAQQNQVSVIRWEGDFGEGDAGPLKSGRDGAGVRAV
jgi:hypothetical protein